MSDSHNRSSARRGDYVWQFEYYDDDEPVSFEGLKAHRYSIVIAFWVGLAAFVLFMFFVLALLSKAGAPHQENPDPAEKHHRPGSRLLDIDGPLEDDDGARGGVSSAGVDGTDEEAGGRRPLAGPTQRSESEDKEGDFFFFSSSHFNIPNFVNPEHGSTLGGEPSVALEPRPQDAP